MSYFFYSMKNFPLYLWSYPLPSVFFFCKSCSMLYVMFQPSDFLFFVQFSVFLFIFLDFSHFVFQLCRFSAISSSAFPRVLYYCLVVQWRTMSLFHALIYFPTSLKFIVAVLLLPPTLWVLSTWFAHLLRSLPSILEVLGTIWWAWFPVHTTETLQTGLRSHV